MSGTGGARRRAGLIGLPALSITIVLALLALDGGHAARAGAASPLPSLYPGTDVTVPAREVVMLGATSGEPGAPNGATWGLGELGEGKEVTPQLVRYVPEAPGSAEGRWEDGPELPAGFAPDHPHGEPSPLEGQIDAAGFGVLAGTLTTGSTARQTLLVRRPGGAFEATPEVPSAAEAKAGEEPVLQEGQTLFGIDRAPLVAPLAESDGSAGALLVPVYREAGVDDEVLHFNGHSWSAERIVIPAESSEEFKVLAIAADGPEHAWLLARLASAYGENAVALFRRVAEGGGYTWKLAEAEVEGHDSPALRAPAVGGPAGGEPLAVNGAQHGNDIEVESQLLTVTEQGVWVDGVRSDVATQQPFTTVFVRSEGERAVVEHSWCVDPAGQPACQSSLPLEPPVQDGRSFAWPASSSYGERVITGLREGVVLRLAGEEFEPMLSVGGGETPESVPGRLLGAAFSSSHEGWLGLADPVHLTPVQVPDRLTYWPVATRHPLLALAPEPGAPPAVESSEALAVGGDGGVARYKPGQGWLPESLFGPGERVEHPNLRAVAWPTPQRAYAVGEAGEMWLWRGETGLWERDPATPLNFRDNLYGIAFDPADSARGYAVGTKAVGEGSVLLRYGKTWTTETALPPELPSDAQFSGIAFAGSEAMVAYSYQVKRGEDVFRGGLLVNGGGGWSVDAEEQAATGGRPVDAVAGLPDGGAAVLVGRGDEGARLYERESATAPWRVAAPALGNGLTGSIALFREGGALRALLSGAGSARLTEALPTEPGPGFPPDEQPAADITGGSGAVLRQTASGWRDERHDIDPVGQGEPYGEYDEPYTPDPAVSALVSEDGSQAWIVGGLVGERENEQAADVARYEDDTAAGGAPNEGTVQVPLESEEPTAGGTGEVTTLGFGGSANCADPCLYRALDRIGPQTWLSDALGLATAARLPAFFYTGPMIRYAGFSGTPPAPPYSGEYDRYAGLLGSAGLPSYTDASDGELEGEPSRLGAFAGLPAPLGGGASAGWQSVGSPPSERQGCGCAGDYYAVGNAHVVVAVLDDSANGAVEAQQRAWLEQVLQTAGASGRPLIVVAEADLPAQLAPGSREPAAEALFAAMVGRDPDGLDPGHYGASAYFYDAPENNVQQTISFAGAHLAAFGSGTLGYEYATDENTTEFHGAKGVMLGEVLWGQRGAGDVAPVRVRLIPLIEELAMEAEDGTLLQRSHVALFSGLARRPRSGCRAGQNESSCNEDQYVPIPENCVGVKCGEGVFPEYEYRSSRPDIGGFVKLNTAANEPRSVLQNSHGEPVKDGTEVGGEQVGATSGLFCAYNAGETNVTIVAGGHSYTLPVTVQAGSVREPCGTVPLRELPTAESTGAAPPPPSPSPTQDVASGPASTPPPIPLPPAPATPHLTPPPARPAALPTPFLPLATPATPLLAFVPPPLPTPARPTPPSGTSPVTSPVEAAEKEEEQEEAPESVSNKAVAYDSSEHEPLPLYVLGAVVLAAFAGASVRRRGRRGRREVRIAPAHVSAARPQRWRGGSRRSRW